MAPRLVTIQAIVQKDGYLWVPVVIVNGVEQYRSEGVVSYSKALRNARDYARRVGDYVWQNGHRRGR